MWVLKLNSKVLCQHNVYNGTLPLLLNGSGDGIAKPNNNNNKRRNCTPKCGIVVQIQYSIYCIYWCHCVLWRLIIPTLDAMFVFHLFYSWDFPSLSFSRWGPFCQPPPPLSRWCGLFRAFLAYLTVPLHFPIQYMYLILPFSADFVTWTISSQRDYTLSRRDYTRKNSVNKKLSNSTGQSKRWVPKTWGTLNGFVWRMLCGWWTIYLSIVCNTYISIQLK